MPIITKPNIQIPWADTGNKEVVTEAKIRQGWVAEIPKAENENWSQNRQDAAIMHIFQTGMSQWDADTPYTAGKSYVQGSDGNIYVALADSVGQNPVNSAAWRLWGDKNSKLANESRTISTGTGLQGGGNLSANRTLSLANSGVNPGNYGSSGSVPAITVDATGRIVAAQNQAIDFASPMNQKNFSDPGFQVFPGGLILQWGRNILPTQLTGTVAFPMAFPNACLNIVASKGATISPNNEFTVGVQPENTSGFRYLISNAGGGTQTIFWQAIGF